MVKWNWDGYVLVVMRICYCCFCYLSPFLCTVYPWYASLLLLYHHGSANISLCSFSFQKSASGHGGSADAAGATKEEEGSGGLPATVCFGVSGFTLNCTIYIAFVKVCIVLLSVWV